MVFVPNPGLPGIAVIEGSAIFTLLVLYWLLAKGFPARFFRLWMAGWAVYAGFSASRAMLTWHSDPLNRLLALELSFSASVLFLAAVLDYVESAERLRWLFVLGTVVASVLLVETWYLQQPLLAQWTASSLECALYFTGGWLLWRSPRRQMAYGVALLGAALLLRGLNGMDTPDWPAQTFYTLRLSFAGVLEVAMGIAMAVLVLEAARIRIEDLNEKLRRLAMITAAATQSFRMEEVLGQVLQHLVESLNVSHGLVRLLDGQGDSAALLIRASVGFSPEFLREKTRLPASAPWARKVLEQGIPFLAYAGVADPEIRHWMEAEKLAAIVLVRIPGKDSPLGILGIGAVAQRPFQEDEVGFLVNVANLLGLTIQNVWLFEEVASAQRQWAYTFDSIDDFILVHDRDCRIVRANQPLAERLGCRADSLVGRPVRDVLRRSETRWSRCPYCEGAAGKPERPDPTFAGYFLATNSDFHDPAGERLGTIHVLKDFTDRREAESKFRTLFQNLREGVFISTPEGRFLDFNDAFMRILGYESREELLKSEIAPTFYADPADRDRLKRILKEGGEAIDFEFRLRRRDGEIRTVTESSFTTRDASGDVTAYQGFVLDVTERKRAEQEIRRRNRELMMLNSIAQMLGQSLDSEEVLGRVIHQVVDLFGLDLGAVYLLDQTTCNFRRAAATGFRSEYARYFPPTTLSKELVQQVHQVHQVHATLLSPKSLPLPDIFREMEGKEGILDSHLVVLWAKDRIIGGLFVASRTRREFSGAELNLLAAVGNQVATSIDKSLLHQETRKAFENLRRTQEQLLQSAKMSAVGQLISGVAHELNNPLTAILGYSQLLSSSDHLSPRGADYVLKLYKQAQRTHRIVQNLLSFARQQKPERAPAQVNQIVEDTITLREYDLKVNNICVHREFGADLPLISGDSHQLQQVFLNILNNAVDAILESSGHGDIWISTAAENGSLRIEFTDSGPGVKDSLRVFDPFYTTKPVGKGTGLGLSICYGIIKEHGGEIEVRNSPPRGATFSILLPLSRVEYQAGQRPAADETLALGRVLLVDDEEAVLELEQEILRKHCQEIQVVHSGREAIQALESNAVDVIVTDLKMPGDVSGSDIYEWVEQNRPELAARIIFTMSNVREDEARALLEKSGCPSVQKPFHIEEFLGAIRRALLADPQSSVKR